MTRQAVSTNGAPAAIGPYSQGIVSGDLVFCSGQLGLDPVTGDLVDGGVDDLLHDVAPLADLRSRHGSFFVTGNHEYYSGAAE